MNDKLYLIRSDLERFIGPMTKKQLTEDIEAMKVGLEDEVAASCGKWVALENIDAIAKNYPELVPIVKQQAMRSWSGIDHDTRGSRKLKSKKSSFLPISTILFILLGIAAGVYYISWNPETLRTVLATLQSHKNTPLEKMNQLYLEGNYNELEDQLQQKMPTIEKAIRTAKGTTTGWLPLVRWYAIRNGGTFGKLDQATLLGQAVGNFKDCSVSFWTAQWALGKDQFVSFVEGETLPKTPWTSILLWDPQWIARRVKNPGWLPKQNPYLYCLTMARTAIIGAQDAVGYGVVSSRLEWLAHRHLKETAGREYEMSGALWTLSCLESADNLNAVRECGTKLPKAPEWRQVASFRAKLRQGFLKSGLSQAELADVEGALPDIVMLAGISYQPELQFLGQLSKNGGNHRGAREWVRNAFPNVSFAGD